MARPRSSSLKIGDKVSNKGKEGVVVFIEPNLKKNYSVHFYPTGRGLFEFNELKKIKPLLNLAETVDEDFIMKEEIHA